MVKLLNPHPHTVQFWSSWKLAIESQTLIQFANLTRGPVRILLDQVDISKLQFVAQFDCIVPSKLSKNVFKYFESFKKSMG